MYQYHQPVQSNAVVTYDFMNTFPDGENLPQSGQQYVAYYDNVLGDQILNNMYAIIPPQSRTDFTSPSSTASPPSSTSSGRRLSMSPDSYVLPRKERRRYQNRMSQRAFRQRKDQERATLQDQLNQLADKHQRLLESYSGQSDEVRRLRAEIQELTKTIDALSRETLVLQMDGGPDESTYGSWTDDHMQAYPFNTQ